jgi:glucokinase
MFLAGDIGGTKTILSLVSAETGPGYPHVETRFPSGNYPRLADIVKIFLSDNGPLLEMHPISAAAFGVSGPVGSNQSAITNLEWTVDQSTLADTLDLPAGRIRLLNDLEATANAVPYLKADDLYTLNEGEPVVGSPIAVIAPGTGLGEAYLTWNGHRYSPFPSEGGHADFAPGDQLQLKLLNYLAQRYGHVSIERVCSGIGIPNIYNFLRDEEQVDEPEWLRQVIAESDDPVPSIIDNAGDSKRATQICRKTLEIFVSILGAQSGNLALTLMARNGVYLGGGIPPRIIPALTGPNFRQSFCDKGRFTEMMSKIPVHIILNPRTALLGAAYAALELGD